MINLIAVLSSSPIFTSVNPGMQTMSIPFGARKPLAIAIAFVAWFTAPAPIACNSASPCFLITSASAPAAFSDQSSPKSSVLPC